MENKAKTERTRVRRFASRGDYQQDTILEILDSCLIAHVAFVHEGVPSLLPMIFWRCDDYVYFHGQRGNRMLTDLLRGSECTMAVTALDGLVLARRSVHHSANYRCVLIIGRPVEISDPDEKLAAMKGLFDRLYPGRWPHVRKPTDAELHGLRVMKLPLDEASAKLRQGHPMPKDEDVAVWAGFIPIRTVVDPPVPDDLTRGRFPEPDYAENVARILSSRNVEH